MFNVLARRFFGRERVTAMACAIERTAGAIGVDLIGLQSTARVVDLFHHSQWLVWAVAAEDDGARALGDEDPSALFHGIVSRHDVQT
jgi:hypothetical protein